MRIAFLSIGVLIASLAILDWLAPGADVRQKTAAIPLRSGTGVPSVGERLFQAECARCHGADLKGTQKGPPLLHPYYRPDHHADIAIYLAVRDGVVQHHWNFGNMPPVPTVDRVQVRDIVAFVRQAQQRAGLF